MNVLDKRTCGLVTHKRMNSDDWVWEWINEHPGLAVVAPLIGYFFLAVCLVERRKRLRVVTCYHAERGTVPLRMASLSPATDR